MSAGSAPRGSPATGEASFRCKVSLWGCTGAEFPDAADGIQYAAPDRERQRDADVAIRSERHARGLELIRRHRMGATVSGATIMLNAATTMKFLGLSAKALPIFRHVSRVYSETLDPGDYRFAGLYNNMALAFEDTGDYDSAQRHFFMALDIIKSCKDPGNDTAVTWCNLAELYERMGRDEDIEPALDNAYACLTDPELPRDGYNAFTLSKCIPTFDRFGYFIYVKALRERMEAIK